MFHSGFAILVDTLRSPEGAIGRPGASAEIGYACHGLVLSENSALANVRLRDKQAFQCCPKAAGILDHMDDSARPRRTQEERKAHSRRRIIRAAIELFARQGYLRTTLNEVGDAAGYTGGLVSHRFGSKQGLLHAVVESIGSRFFQDQLQPFIEDVSAEVSIKQYIDIYLREILVRESRMRALYVIMGEALGSVPEIAHEIVALNDKHRKAISTIVRRGIRSGEFRRTANPEATAVIILAQLRGITMQSLVDPGAFDVQSMIPHVQEHVLKDLKKKPARRNP